MAKTRVVNTRFWSDTYIADLDPLGKLLFIYFITNQYTNLSGIYEIPIKQIALDTGIDKDNLEKVFLPKFEEAKKIYYIDGWIYIKNFQKHQKSSGNIQAGIKNALKDIPDNIIKKVNEINNSQTEVRGTSDYPQTPEKELKLNLIKLNLIKDIASPFGDATAKTDKKPLGHKETIKYFHDKVKTECGDTPVINGGKDGAAVKKALSKYKPEEIKKIIDFYLESEKVEKFGYNLSVALSADTINKWLYEEKRLR